MSSYPEKSSLVLVGVIPAPRDLEIVRLLGWYRIPLRFAPKVLDVDYLAFYQTGAFGEAHRWCIESFAEVHGHELTTRLELFRDQPDHPRAQEEYFKIQLGPIQNLPKPVLAQKWKRITFLYTTGELIQKAETVSDLVVRSQERKILWRSLRERAVMKGGYKASHLPENEFDLDPALLIMLGELNSISEETLFYDID
ncbi:MAG: hypothetical protein MUO76_01360 [Anaerolineaceae bacterium]|nr:hypothetical protein [Anaerolineaceae bacterium]